MAYSDYGSFVYLNGERRPDKEDVGVYDTDEADLPSALRIFVNIQKARDTGRNEWWRHSQHGVMGDGVIRVACYKQGLPKVYFWEEVEESPAKLPNASVIELCGGVEKLKETGAIYEWEKPEYIAEYGRYDLESFDYGVLEFEFRGHRFKFSDRDCSNSGRYEAEMVTPEGDKWLCVYDYLYGAGHTDAD